MSRPTKSPDGRVLADVSLTEAFVSRVAVGDWRSQPHVAQAFAQCIEGLRAAQVAHLGEIERLRARLAEADALLAEAAAEISRLTPRTPGSD